MSLCLLGRRINFKQKALCVLGSLEKHSRVTEHYKEENQNIRFFKIQVYKSESMQKCALYSLERGDTSISPVYVSVYICISLFQ